MIILPKIKCRSGENLGVEILIHIPNLEGNFTFLNTDYAAGVSSFDVDNGSKFATDDYFVIGNIQSQKTEIIKVSTVAATSIATATASLYAHSRGEKIQFIPYNQIEVYSSTDGTTYSLLTILDIRVDSLETYYNDLIGTSTTYYKVRFKNSTSSKYSEYSDSIVGSGYVENSVGSIIRKSLISLGQDIEDTLITKEFLYESINELRREIDEHKDVIRWPFRTVFGYNAGSVISGKYKITLPTNLHYSSNNENVLSVRIGKKRFPLIYKDIRFINNFFTGNAHTTLNGAIVTGDTSIILTSSGDFDDSGSIYIAGEAVDEDIDIVTYTANDLATNTLSGVTGIRAAGHSTLVDVWQGAQAGIPQYYTVDNGEIIFNCPFGDDYSGENIWIDYYKNLTDVNSDSDLLDEPFYMIYVSGLKWKIKSKKDPTLQMANDPDYMNWNHQKENQVSKLYTGQSVRINIG